MKRQEHHFEVTLLILVLLFYILTPLSYAPTKVKIYPRKTPPEKTIPPKEKIPTVKPAPEKTYDETVSGWKSYQDLVKWMENDFSFDKERYGRFERTLPVPRTPEKTFQLKSGIYIDAAMFLKETLNRINPSYKAQIVILVIRPYGFNH